VAANAFFRFYERYVMALGQKPGGGKAGYTRANHGNFERIQGIETFFTRVTSIYGWQKKMGQPTPANLYDPKNPLQRSQLCYKGKKTVYALAWNMLKPEILTGRQNEDQVTRRLLQSVAKNLDREAFAGLFDAFAPRLKSFMIRKGASPELAEDLVQETMISVWRKAGLYDPTKGSVLTWVFTIARNLRIDRIRKESSMPLAELGDYDAPSDDLGSDDVLSRKQESQQVARALAEIPIEQKQVIMLAFVDDISQSEIAERLNLPLGTVKSRMRLAYARLRKSLETLN
jgi:RNA polymerase sigma-70 factor, ECF subfamily